MSRHRHRRRSRLIAALVWGTLTLVLGTACGASGDRQEPGPMPSVTSAVDPTSKPPEEVFELIEVEPGLSALLPSMAACGLPLRTVIRCRALPPRATALFRGSTLVSNLAAGRSTRSAIF